MKVWARHFNIYLAVTVTGGVLCGCLTNRPHGPTASLRVYIEASRNSVALGTGQTISVLRADPVLVNIVKQPVLTEANLIGAKLIEAPGGFAIQVHFDETGGWILEQETAANPGRHFVISGHWGEKLAKGRWLAAPLITRRIANGTLAFTPDMSHAEAEQLVTGLGNVAHFNKEQPK